MFKGEDAMPDGDNVRKRLARKYHRAYKEICAGKSEDEELAVGVVSPTVEQIKEYGDEALQFLAEIVHICKDMQVDMPLFSRQVDWHRLWDKIEKVAQETCMDKRAKHLVLQACKEQISKIRQGENVDNIHIQMLRGYFWRIYRADFEAYVKSGLDHMYYTNPAVVNETLARIEPEVWEKFLPWAEQAYRNGTVTTLRQRLRHADKRKGVPIDFNLLTL